MIKSFALQIVAAPPALADLGTLVELHELNYRDVRRVLASSPSAEQAGETLLGACLVVDGEPLGFDALQDLPGRFSGGISSALQTVLELHGMRAPAPPAAANDDDEEDLAPGEALP